MTTLGLRRYQGLLQANPSIPKEILEAATLFDEELNLSAGLLDHKNR